MRDIRKYALRLSSCGLVIALLTYISWRHFFGELWSFGLDPRLCPGGAHSLGSGLWRFGAYLYLAATVLSLASLVLGLAALKIRASLMGLAAIGICFANFSHLPSADSMRLADSTATAILRTINTAEVTLRAGPTGRYGTISDLVKATFLDELYEHPPVGGYTYDVVVGEGTYVATATPTPGFPAACWEYYSTEEAKVFYSNDPRKAPKGRAGTLVQ